MGELRPKTAIHILSSFTYCRKYIVSSECVASTDEDGPLFAPDTVVVARSQDAALVLATF
jgi:hypothetical protein